MNYTRFFIAIFLAFLISGCLSTSPADSGQAPIPDKEADQQENRQEDKPEDKQKDKKSEESLNEISFVISKGQLDFDPLHAYSSTECQLYTALYEGLVSYNPVTLEPLPGAASDWEASDDGLVYTFYLREGLVFSNGDRITAEDIKQSWLRMIDPVRKAEYSVFFEVIKGVKDYKGNPDSGTEGIGIKVKDEATLEVTLDKPASHFLKLICHMSFVILHQDYRNREGWGFGVPGVTNGPFIMVERSAKGIVLAKNNLYWDARDVAIDRITVLFSEDEKQTANLFNSGLVQWALTADVESIKDKNALILNPMFSTTYFYFNCDKPPFDDPNVRRGLALLLPWNEMRSKDYLFTAETLVPKISGYPEITGITRMDEAGGLKLLAEAGFEKGESMPPITINISDDEDSKRLAGLMKKSWEDALGCKVNITARESNDYFKSLKSESYTLAMMSWIGDFADPLTFLQMWTSRSNLNDAKFANSEYDNLIDESLKERGREKYEVLGKAEQIILDGAAVLPIRRHPAFNLVNLKIIDGWYPNVLDIHPFKYIKFREDEILPNVTIGERPSGEQRS